jgi:hypothetical protein
MRKILLKVLLLLFVIFVIGFVTPNMVLAQACIWVGVENARINSHQPGQSWCPPGHFLTALDLDGPRNYSAHDSPVVGQALCCQAAPGASWGDSTWVGVEKAGIDSHQQGKPWCPSGYFLTALDLDGLRNYSAHDSPVVGQALCSSIAGTTPNWRECRWVGVEVAGINSHQPGPSWCPSGAFLVALDLDGPRNYAAHDSPIVGHAMCCSP